MGREAVNVPGLLKNILVVTSAIEVLVAKKRSRRRLLCESLTWLHVNYIASSMRFEVAVPDHNLEPIGGNDQRDSKLIRDAVLFHTMTVFSPEAHQVILNYRGEELRYSFISHLIDAFERHGINFFLDKYEQRGKDLKNLFLRIEESRIALAIFSTRYAESSWCMDELAKMKRLADKRKIQVIPIFYKVRARDVRRQTGEFGDNFWTLAKASSGDQIKKWKEALECISGKMGLSLKDKSSEADFIKEIVKEVVRVIAATGLEDVENHFEKKRRKDFNCPLELPDFKRTRTKKL